MNHDAPIAATIRPYNGHDTHAIADILADGWKVAYGSFMPAAILEPRADKGRRRAELAGWLSDEFDPLIEHILVSDTGSVDGFVHIVLQDKAGLGATANINLLYVRPDRIGNGVGRALLAAAAQWISGRSTGPVALAAYAHSPYRSFYSHIGGTEALWREIDFEGYKLESVYYLWPSPEALRIAATTKAPGTADVRRKTPA